MVVKVMINSIDLFSKFFFWYIFAVSGWEFIFFKLQDRVYTFLPPMSQYNEYYKQYDVLFGIVAATKLVAVMFKIYFE